MYTNDMIEDEGYFVKKIGSLYKLKSTKGTDDFLAVIYLSNKKYSSTSEKPNDLITIKAPSYALRGAETFNLTVCY